MFDELDTCCLDEEDSVVSESVVLGDLNFVEGGWVSMLFLLSSIDAYPHVVVGGMLEL